MSHNPSWPWQKFVCTMAASTVLTPPMDHQCQVGSAANLHVSCTGAETHLLEAVAGRLCCAGQCLPSSSTLFALGIFLNVKGSVRGKDRLARGRARAVDSGVPYGKR